MEKCEIEMSEESDIKFQSVEGSVQNLGKHLGKLFFFLQLTGIPISNPRNAKKQGYLLDLFLKLCYPIFIHISLVYLLYYTLSKGGWNYETIIDTILPILPCIMWIILRMQITSIRLLLNDLSKITSSNFFSSNRRLLYFTNAGIGFIFVYPLLIFTVRAIQGNIINVKEVFRILQETIFPCTMFILYSSICFLLLQKLRFCKKMFRERLDLTCSLDVENMMKDYLNVVKSVDRFENILSNVVFVIVVQDFFTVTILVFDMFLVMETFLDSILYEALTQIIFVFVSLAIMSICAGNITIEMASIKSVLLEKMCTQLEQDYSANIKKRMNLLLKKDICIFTAGKALVFDRAFVLKALVFIFAELVVIRELLWLLK